MLSMLATISLVEDDIIYIIYNYLITYNNSEHYAIDVKPNFEYLFLKVCVVSIDLVDHCLLIGECLDCLNAFIDHLIALFNLLEQ